MENLVNAYKDKKVLVTGHTGFKGSWLCQWLVNLGADVYGLSRKPHTEPNHYDILGLCSRVTEKHGNIQENYNMIEHWKPDIVFHLAANAIVARTFHEPLETFESNVMGAVHLLEACRNVEKPPVIVMITTDKVYANKEWGWGYRENDELGGLDPYSASKVCVEHVIECYRSQFLPMIATARAGNVIGGGDWAYARLIPDIVRATIAGQEVEIHTPNATRPWQHVLEPLCGYLMLGARLMNGEQEIARNWNFGPVGEMTVLDVLKEAQQVWPEVKFIVKEQETHPSMVQLLKIDSTEARKKLGWTPQWTMRTAVRTAMYWYKHFYDGMVLTNEQINSYCNQG
jgi:CDP-glucose 4,6-dehydratase